MARQLDETDLALIAALRRDARTSIAELARVAGISRGTAYSRLDRLEREGVVSGYVPDIDPGAAGFGVLAFTTLEIAQGSHDETTKWLSQIPEVLEIHTITGAGDLLCRIVARSNDHLHRVLQQMTALSTVNRSETQLALSTALHRSVADLVAPR